MISANKSGVSDRPYESDIIQFQLVMSIVMKMIVNFFSLPLLGKKFYLKCIFFHIFILLD